MIRLMHTVRNINYLLSLITAISIIIHKSFERRCENSPGFGHRPPVLCYSICNSMCPGLVVRSTLNHKFSDWFKGLAEISLIN